MADIYLSDLKQKILEKFEVSFFRYVDDILILCSKDEAPQIKDYITKLLKEEYLLDAHEKKTHSGILVDGVPFLGYIFYNNRISVREAAIKKLEKSLEDLFRKHKKGVINYELFLFRLNLKITGCILGDKRYGWTYYYSQLTDLSILYHLDWITNKLFKRFKITKTDDIKSYVHTYFEITQNRSQSTYLFNADRLSIEEKLAVLRKISPDPSKLIALSLSEIEERFKAAMFKEVDSLEKDIQNFS